MINKKVIFTRGLFVIGLLVLTCVFYTTCNNPIMEQWWSEPQSNNTEPDPVNQEPFFPGGSGDNFAVVNFDTNGGTPQPRGIKIVWGGVIGRLRPINRGTDGFIGWFDEKDSLWDVETRPVTQEDDVDGDGFITLTIKWVSYIPPAPENPPDPSVPSPAYIVKYVPYPNVAPPASNPVVIADQYIAAGARAVPPVVEPPVLDDGRSFAGWFTEDPTLAETNDQHRWNFAFPVSSNVTLYAKWEQNTRTVKFNANGGRRPDGLTELKHEFTVSLSYGLVQDPGPLIKDGYSFSGWYVNPDFSGQPWNFATKNVKDSDVPQTNPLTLYAKWIKNIYLVNFIITPSAADAPGQQKISHGEKVKKPDDPPQLGDGRGFAGWFMEELYFNQWNFNDPVTATMTLYAKFVPQTRTVVFNVNGGNDMSRSNFTISLNSGRIINPGSPSRAGHTFTGWFINPECTTLWNFASDRITIPDNVIGEDPMYLYAGWSTNPSTVTFITNEAPAITPNTQSVKYGERAERPSVPENPGKVLEGWYKNSGYSDAWDFDHDTVTSDTKLYAKWSDKEYTVVFHLGNANGNPPHTIYSSNKPSDQYTLGLSGTVFEPFMPPLPVSDTTSWSFYGWYASDDPAHDNQTKINTINIGTKAVRDMNLSGEPWDFSTPVSSAATSAGVLNLYARWVEPKPDMIWVPRGSFTMGDSGVSGTPAAYHAYPVRKVTVDGFYISRYEVTEINSPDTSRGYYTIMGVNPSQFSKNSFRPIERVSWYDAIEYCNKLSIADGLGSDKAYTMNIISRADTPLSGTGTPGIKPITNATVTCDWTKTGYRLPTEAEWEYAARGGNGSPGNFMYAGSNTAEQVAWFNTTVQTQPAGMQATQPVGGKNANALGIYDMSGNVSEWVWDCFDSYKNIIAAHYPGNDAYNNPRGPLSGDQRVRRGGGWSNALGNVRSVVRNSDTPDTANWVIGFRVVRGPSIIY